MTAFLDTNVLIAAVTNDTDRSETAIRILNELDAPKTSILSLMELRSVLTKKKGFERDHVQRIESRIAARTTVTFPDASDVVAANELQSTTLLYPMDALMLAVADAVDATLVTFDSELHEHGAVEPAEFDAPKTSD